MQKHPFQSITDNTFNGSLPERPIKAGHPLLCAEEQFRTRRMFWRRASIQDGQAFTSAWWRHCSQTIFQDNFVIFRPRSKRIAFLESVNFSTCAYMQIFNFRDGHVTTFRHLSGAYIWQIPGHRLSKQQKHTVRVSAFHRYHWFGVKLFPGGCAQDSRRVPWKRENAVLDLAPPTLKNSEIFHDSTRPYLHFDGMPPKSRRAVVSI